jgi:hypothetical protein
MRSPSEPYEMTDHDKDRISGGYQPDISNLNPQNPPQGGSGVPPIQTNLEV